MIEEILIGWAFSLLIDQIGLLPFGLGVIGLVAVTLLLYIKAMHLISRRDRGRLRWYHYVWAVPVFGIGFPADIAVNVIVGTMIFREAPREWLYTARLDRHARAGSRIAKLQCRVLNIWDKDHCFDGR